MAGKLPPFPGAGAAQGPALGADTSGLPFPGRTGSAAKKEKEKKKPGGILGALSSLPGVAVPGMPVIWAEEKLGILPHTLAHIAYGLGSTPKFVAHHPVKTAAGGAAALKGIVELGLASPSLIEMARDPSGYAKKAKKMAGLVIHETKADYKHRYGPEWERYGNEDPFNNLMDLTTVFGGYFRGAAMAGAAERLAPGEAKLATALAHTKAVWKESGNFAPRALEYTTPEGTVMSSVQPTSRSPLRAAIQHGVIDPASRNYPEARVFGAKARVTRAQSTQIQRAVNRTMAAIPGVDAVGRLSKPESSRIYWGSQMGKYDGATLRRLRTAVKSHQGRPFPGDDAAYGEWIQRAKEAGFGPNMLHSLDEAISHADKFPQIAPDSKMAHAINALEHVTRASEETQLNEAGFNGVLREIENHKRELGRLTDPDQIARVEAKLEKLIEERDQTRVSFKQMFEKRRSILPDFVAATTGVRSATRDAVIADLTKRVNDPDMVKAVVKATDRLAIGQRPGNPGSYWDEVVGRPSGESATAFMKRWNSLPEEERGPLYQYALGAFGGERAGQYFSPLVDAIDRMQGKQMTIEQFRKYLGKEGIEVGERELTGVEALLDSRQLGDMVTKAELESLIRSPDNAMRLVEHRWTNDRVEGTRQPPYLQATAGGINSRYAEPGEYTHIAIGLDPQGVEHYGEYLLDEPGKGFLHTQEDTPWGQPSFSSDTPGQVNVIGHIRLHIFTDEFDGKKKLLVEEVQSDWARDFAKEAERRGPYKSSDRTPISKADQKRLTDLKAEMESLNTEINASHERGLAGDLESDPADLEARFTEVMSEIEQIRTANAGRLAPSPLGPKRHLNTLAHRIADEAHKNEVDQIVVVDGPTQTVRNARDEVAMGLVPWDAPTTEIARAIRKANPKGAFVSIYEKDLPKALAKATGETFHHDPEAYTGEFRNAYHSTYYSEEGPMGGTVFDLGENAAKKAEQMRPLYQQAKRGRLPNGAAEFFQDGTSAIRLFKNADISTYLHELSHVALHDLPKEDKAILEKHFGNGTPVAKWTNDMHEEYAKSFERYMATGKAPTLSLEATFAKIADWMGALWKMAKQDIPDIHPEVREVFDSMFAGHDAPTIFMPHRPGAVSLSGSRGTQGAIRARRDIGDEVMTQAASYKKNRLSLLRSGMLNPDPRVALEQANKVTMLAKANQLRDAVVELSVPLKPGQVPDLRTQYVVKRAGRRADQALYDALETADNVDEVQQRIQTFVDDHIQNDPAVIRKWEIEVANDPSASLAVVNKSAVDHLYKNVTGKLPGKATKPVNTGTKLMDATLDSVRGMLLYANPGFYVANMAGNSMMLAMSDPRAARYLPWSMKQAFKGFGGRGEKADPLWQRIAVEQGRGATAGSMSERRPELLGQGRKVAGGYLDKEAVGERIARFKHTAKYEKAAFPGRAAGNVSHAWGSVGRNSGRVIDDAFRVAVWRQTAAKLGYESDRQITKLLDDAVRDSKGKMLEARSKSLRDLNRIRDESEQLMLDFDSMTPFEKTWLTRALFLYPFIKASAKYPLMYMGERPITAGLLGQAGMQAQSAANQMLGPDDPNLPVWMKDYARTPWGYLPVSSVSSFQPLGALAAAAANAPGEARLGIQRPADFFNPAWVLAAEMAFQQNKFGRSSPFWKTGINEFPSPAYLKQATGMKQPGKIYADRDFLHTLMRAFRLPFQIDESEARRQEQLGGR